MDREKVIKAVDSCFDYWLDQHRYLDPLELEPVRQRKAEALALLKEQEAVEPIKMQRMDDNFSFFVPYYLCGNCKYELVGKDVMFCSHCGKSVKWE